MPCGAVSFFDTLGEGMNIFINPLSDKAAPMLQTKPTGSPISQLRFKRGSSVPLTVMLLGVTEAPPSFRKNPEVGSY